MTPMIDVVFLLLIFFVCASAVPVAEVVISSPLKKMDAEASTLPENQEEEKLSKLAIRKTNENGLQLEINDSEDHRKSFKSFKGLNLFINKERDRFINTSLILDIGPDITMKTVLEAYDLCDQFDFQQISFGVHEVSSN